LKKTQKVDVFRLRDPDLLFDFNYIRNTVFSQPINAWQQLVGWSGGAGPMCTIGVLFDRCLRTFDNRGGPTVWLVISSPHLTLPLVDFTMSSANRTKVADTYAHVRPSNWIILILLLLLLFKPGFSHTTVRRADHSATETCNLGGFSPRRYFSPCLSVTLPYKARATLHDFTCQARPLIAVNYNVYFSVSR